MPRWTREHTSKAIVALYVAGCTPREIAKASSYSVRTVQRYLAEATATARHAAMAPLARKAMEMVTSKIPDWTLTHESRRETFAALSADGSTADDIAALTGYTVQTVRRYLVEAAAMAGNARKPRPKAKG